MRTEKRDSFYTVFSRDNGVFISGVEIAATAFANLLEDAPVKPLDSQSYLVIILLWGILVGVVCGIAPTVVAVPAIIGLSLLYLLAAEFHFAADGTWYPVVIPLFFQTPGGLSYGAFSGTILRPTKSVKISERRLVIMCRTRLSISW